MPEASSLRCALAERAVVADGAMGTMGTMLQAHDLSLADFIRRRGSCYSVEHPKATCFNAR
jgi:methionine synthase I (cobalamin-dependent)